MRTARRPGSQQPGVTDGKQNDNKGSLTNTGAAVLGVGIFAVLFAASGGFTFVQ